jgi:serine/threonine protein kinase/tetratricopeptide (TPR) repeat protein
MNELDIFSAAVELTTLEEREKYLADACGDNDALRERIRSLLRSSSAAGSFIESPAHDFDFAATIDGLIAECPGTVIGPYKLLQQIGEGGMGVVFMAEQTEAIRRTVALKIIKPGMDTRQVIARFEAERHALAMMDHPNIAKVLDAGTTDTGRPYFVMELVKGVPITKYCDDKQLSLRDRLSLFMSVCQAVQHAHQKGIIHRDIKPTNVLVAEYDNKAVPKIIDFGVAKATAQKLTERTMFTEFGQVIGTVGYMSPEQAKLNQFDIDTRSDIYSLGVLLYELLTGETPFDRKRLHSAAFDEMLRIIREEEPPKPSTKISRIESLPSVAANRHTEPTCLSKDVQGELDWIVMKALEKDRNRRYETASGFAADVERHLRDEPVEAGPPSARYRLGKFARRNRLAIFTVTSIAGAMVLGTIVSIWQAVRAEAEAQKAVVSAQTAQAVIDFLNWDLLGQADDNLPRDGYTRADGEMTLRGALDRAAGRLDGRFSDKPLVEAAIRHMIGYTYSSFGDESGVQAEPHLNRAYELRRMQLGNDDADTIKSLMLLAYARKDVPLQREAVVRAVRALGEEHALTQWCRFNLALTLRHIAQVDEAEPLLRNVLAAHRRTLGSQHADTAWTAHCLAGCLDRGPETDPADVREIEELYREALAVSQKQRGDWSWHTSDTALRLGQFLRSRGRLEEAAKILQDGYARLESGPVNTEWALPLVSELEALYQEWGKPAEAAQWRQSREVAIQKQLARNSRLLRENLENPGLLLSHGLLLEQIGQNEAAEGAYRLATQLLPNNARAHQRLGDVLRHLNRYDEAEAAYRLAIGLAPADDSLHIGLGVAFLRQSRLAEAEAEFRQAIRLKPSNAWNHHWLGDALKEQSRWEEAEVAYREAIRLEPNDAGRYINLCDTLAAQGKRSEALRELQKQVERRPTSPAWQRALGHFQCYQMSEPEKALRPLLEAVRLDPGNAHAHYDVGSAYAFMSQWDKATASYRRAVELNLGGDSESRYRLAALYLYHGDLDNYRVTCSEMLERYAMSNDPHVIDCTAKICLLCPENNHNREQALKLAERNVRETQNHPAYRWFVLAKGLADYRADRLADALARLEQFAPNASGRHADATGFALLAMVHHGLHQDDKARHALASARSVLTSAMPDPTNGRPFGDDWHDWLHSRLLVSEADRMIEKQASTRQRKTENDKK